MRTLYLFVMSRFVRRRAASESSNTSGGVLWLEQQARRAKSEMEGEVAQEEFTYSAKNTVATMSEMG
jgi:hypothetical protein